MYLVLPRPFQYNVLQLLTLTDRRGCYCSLLGGNSSESVVATLRVLQEQLQRKWSKNKDDVTHDMNVYFDANNN
jgi:hypothetical protein